MLLNSRRALTWKLALGAALLAGCGGGGSGSGDTQPPTVALTAPANFADGLTGNVTLTATATDNVGVASVEFQLDGKTLLTTSGPTFSAPLVTGNFASGQHVIRARSRDAAGNVSGWASATVRFGGTTGVPAGFTKNEAWVSGIAAATAFAQAPDGRMFVAEQGGTLRIVQADGTLLPTPFMSVAVSGDFASTERGLLGVALHPNFATTSPFVYVYYTTATAPIHNRVSRFTVNPTNPNLVSANSEVPILDLPNLVATNHNGGAIHFDTDGKLYVGVGENANPANSQDLNSPLGKLLRLNDDGSIPSDNPFCTTAGLQRCAVWARGLRNPFTFAVQPGTGRIHINDVGEGTWEEISLGAAGANFGWPGSEGPDNLNVTPGVTGPLFSYNHSAAVPAGSGPGGFFTGNVIAGGTFYPTSGASAVFPAEYQGQYFFADFGSRFVARLDTANGNVAYAFASLAGNPVDMLVGLDGALYVLTRSAITRISSP